MATELMERTEGISSAIYGDIVPIAAIQQNITRIQTAKAAVMKENVHYGTIPGTPKPTLYKPGAEIINLMFGVSVDPDPNGLVVEEGRDEVGLPFFRCTVRMVLKTRAGVFLGASYGYASSLEEKYKWRRSTGPKEFAAVAEGRKRVKFRRGRDNSEYEELQVRTEDEDLRNTVIQIAMKRAEVSGTKRVHALSDMFSQDLEDLPAEIRESIIDGEVVARDAGNGGGPQPGQRKSEQSKSAAPANGQTTAATTSTGSSAPATDTGGNVRQGVISNVEEKQGPKKTYWYVTLDGSWKCATFSETTAKTARELQASKATVRIAFIPSEDPRFAPKIDTLAAV